MTLKVFIYPENKVYKKLSKEILLPHGQYLKNILKKISGIKTSDPNEADFYFVPINLIHFQFSKEHCDPESYLENLPFVCQGRHILLATGDFGQRVRSNYEYHGADRAYPNIYSWLDWRFHLLAFESTDDLAPWDIAILPFVLPAFGLKK
jgi:hypothetical protein